MRVGEDSKVICVARAEAEPEEDASEAGKHVQDGGSDLDMDTEGKTDAAETDEEI